MSESTKKILIIEDDPAPSPNLLFRFFNIRPRKRLAAYVLEQSKLSERLDAGRDSDVTITAWFTNLDI